MLWKKNYVTSSSDALCVNGIFFKKLCDFLTLTASSSSSQTDNLFLSGPLCVMHSRYLVIDSIFHGPKSRQHECNVDLQIPISLGPK